MEEPEAKKPKHSILSDHFYSSDFQKKLSDHWSRNESLKDNNVEFITQPFRICKVSNFFNNEEYIDELKAKLSEVRTRRTCMDLYQFDQTEDLSDVEAGAIKTLYETFRLDMAIWIERNTHIRLNGHISISSSCYADTDYLLCHDDNLGDRRVAFVLYLTKDWSKEDGGTLDLFDTDQYGLPKHIVKSIVPEYNSLIFFEVVHNSYHQVAEIANPNKCRWSINGWFHGPLRARPKLPRPILVDSFKEPMNMNVDLTSWIADLYLSSDITSQIQENMEDKSYAFLANFLKQDIYNQLMIDLTSSDIRWELVGPADLRRYEVADEHTLPRLLKQFYNLFKSMRIFSLFKDYTELDLVAQEEGMNPRMTIELQRWTAGCYTLIFDKSNSKGDNSSPDKDKKRKGKDDSKSAVSSQDHPKPGRSTEDTLMVPSTSAGRKKRSSESSYKEDDNTDDDKGLNMLAKNRSKKKLDRTKKTPSSESEPSEEKMGTDGGSEGPSDIDDYLSHTSDYSKHSSTDNDQKLQDDGALDIIMQFHTGNIADNQTIDYVEPTERDGALIHIPPVDNHLCLIYKILTTFRVHKYVNHYCEGYFYNLICTYYE